MSEDAAHARAIIKAINELGVQRVFYAAICTYGLEKTLEHIEVACKLRGSTLLREGVDTPQGMAWIAASRKIADTRTKSRSIKGL